MGESDEERRRYIYRIASNLVLAHRRQRRRERRPPSPDPASLVTPEARIDLGRVFARLEPRQRALLWLAYAEGYRHREIAEILGLRPASIKVLLHRARRALRQSIEE